MKIKISNIFAVVVVSAFAAAVSSWSGSGGGGNGTYTNNSDSISITQEEVVDPSTEPVEETAEDDTIDYGSVYGTYAITDINGTKFELTIGHENAVLKNIENGKEAYGALKSKLSDNSYSVPFPDWNEVGPLEMVFNQNDWIHKDGSASLEFAVLKDGWYYSSIRYAETNHPKHRLKVTKIKN